jgi:hypothetical protein
MPVTTDLNPLLLSLLEKLIRQCKERGCEMRPYNGVRTPLAQARLWRQSRTIEEINEQIATFRKAGALFLADCLVKAGPQHGGHVTNAPPGFSWHQWGEAMDCFWVVDGKAEWSTTKKIAGQNGYRVYAEIAAALGLTAGGLWPKFKDWPHVQLSKDNAPSTGKSIMEINDAMQARFTLAT